MSDHTQTLIFRRMFGSGGVASLVISAASNRLPAVICLVRSLNRRSNQQLVKESCNIISAVRPPRPLCGDLPRRSVRILTFLPHQPHCVREEKDPLIRAALRFAASNVAPAPGETAFMRLHKRKLNNRIYARRSTISEGRLSPIRIRNEPAIAIQSVPASI